ncbi:MAG: hypothetical protein LBT53_04780 [Puniceicoccales bacterium]|jgi:hypothetical protein|nr:hypothetical protein [Puniceicoccales bacterium]
MRQKATRKKNGSLLFLLERKKGQRKKGAQKGTAQKGTGTFSFDLLLDLGFLFFHDNTAEQTTSVFVQRQLHQNHTAESIYRGKKGQTLFHLTCYLTWDFCFFTTTPQNRQRLFLFSDNYTKIIPQSLSIGAKGQKGTGAFSFDFLLDLGFLVFHDNTAERTTSVFVQRQLHQNHTAESIYRGKGAKRDRRFFI